MLFNSVYGGKGLGKYKTFTISWTEQSNMSSGWTYSDDAAGMTAGSSDFDNFFGYYPCLINSSGVETAQLNPNDFSKDINGNSVNITNGNNVMIAFPRRGIKMSKSGSVVTLSITDEDNKAGFTYYAHSRGTFDNQVSKDKFYMGAYKGYVSSNVLKSWSGQTPTRTTTMGTFISDARANDNNSGDAGYEIVGFYQYSFIQALYMMKYGNPNSQSVIGQGYYGAGQTTGVNNSLGMNGVSGNRVKLFGLEDFWGNGCEWQGGVCVSSNIIYTALSGYVGDVKTSSPYQSTGKGNSSSGETMASINGTELSMFTSNTGTSTANTYYCDGYTYEANGIRNHGGANHGNQVGIFFSQNGFSASNAYGDIGARLMYL